MTKYISLFGATTTDTQVQVVKENQVIIGIGAGASRKRYVVYKVEHTARGYVYHMVDTETKEISQTDILRPLSQTFGIGRYYDDVNPEFMDAFEAALLVRQAGERATAQAIAAAHRDESDYQKLLSFRDELSLQAGPGGKAAPGGAFGDPWQMVWALDGDPDTEASSEGWARAFQYLCGLAGLREMECYTVSGLTQVGEDLPSPCMWNVIRAGGRSYLADVAGSLDGAAGWDGGLFLAGVRVNEDTTPSGYIADLPAGPVYYWYESGGLAPEVLDLAPCALDPAGA